GCSPLPQSAHVTTGFRTATNSSTQVRTRRIPPIFGENGRRKGRSAPPRSGVASHVRFGLEADPGPVRVRSGALDRPNFDRALDPLTAGQLLRQPLSQLLDQLNFRLLRAVPPVGT